MKKSINNTLTANTVILSNIKHKTDALVRKFAAELETDNAIRASFDMPERRWVHGTVSFEFINFDVCYQREGDKEKKLDIALHYDTDLEEEMTLIYNPNTGYFDCANGTHRGYGQKENNYKFTDARIFLAKTLEESARLFVKLNSSSLSVNSIAKFNADIIGKETYAIKIKELCDEYGVTIKATGAKKRTRNVGAIKFLTETYNHKDYGMDCLRFMFDVLRDSGWMDIESGMTNRNLHVPYHAYKICKNNSAARATLVKHMQALSPSGFEGAAKVKYNTLNGRNGDGHIRPYVSFLLTGKE